ncbi:hypothetical protein ACLGIH_33360 [Streptomyces sp. HMX87]|uniref:hypothetical protein n=1 Tax=Streptomyces sp. HMX87 TaxID=3390849 RepID=UPI003A8AA1F5
MTPRSSRSSWAVSGCPGPGPAARIRVLSTLAPSKFTHLRRAVDLTLNALALLALAAASLAL